MGWLIELIFSNFWIFIILFWVLGSFSKKGKQAKPMPPPVRRNVPSVPRQVSWERDFEPVIPESANPVSRESTPIERKQVEHQHRVKKKHVEPPLPEPTELPSPVQGMMWSQIYGPPRSKQPHRRLKR